VNFACLAFSVRLDLFLIIKAGFLHVDDYDGLVYLVWIKSAPVNFCLFVSVGEAIVAFKLKYLCRN